MQVDRVSFLQPHKPLKVKLSIWDRIKNLIIYLWNKCFLPKSDKSSSQAELPSITKISNLKEIDKINSLISKPNIPLKKKYSTEIDQAQIDKVRANEKISIQLELNALAEVLATGLNGQYYELPRPHVNFSKTCYMNSALQSFNVAYRASADLQKLIKMDLSWKKDDSFDSLEERFSSWAPIDDKRSDRILFKWSFLLYMQACRYGSDKQVETALSICHRVCFAIANPEFTSLPGATTINESHAAPSYMELWYEMLGLGVHITSHKKYNLNGVNSTSHPIQSVEKGINLKFEKDETFLDGLAKFFSSASTVRLPGVSLRPDQIQDISKIDMFPPKEITFNVNVNNRQNELIYSKEKRDRISYMCLLDLNPYFDKDKLENAKANYAIAGLTVYAGDIERGHYHSYIRRKTANKSSQWYMCNDSEVVPVKIEDVPFSRAATLSYVKVNNV